MSLNASQSVRASFIGNVPFHDRFAARECRIHRSRRSLPTPAFRQTSQEDCRAVATQRGWCWPVQRDSKKYHSQNLSHTIIGSNHIFYTRSIFLTPNTRSNAGQFDLCLAVHRQLCRKHQTSAPKWQSLRRKIFRFRQEFFRQSAFVNYAKFALVNYEQSRNSMRNMAVLPRANTAHEVDPNET